VTRDVPPYALMTGNPARRRGYMCRCGIKLDAALACPSCARAYREQDGLLAPL
jgi:UDP-2-acetamido-3-amino-2,3-dideoxy-glucuronate N-acetyltransferase